MRSIEITLKLLEELAKEGSGLSVHDMGRRLSFSKSTTHRALQAMAAAGFAEQDPITQRYRCGPKVLDLAMNFMARFDLKFLAQPILQRIRNELNENVYLCVYTQRTLYFFDKIESSHPIRYINPMGRREYLHAGAPGKVIMAYLEPGEVQEIIDRGLPAFTKFTITDPVVLKRELVQIRSRGFAFSRSEFTLGGVAFAAPLLNEQGRPYGCIDVVIPNDRYDQEKDDIYTRLVTEGARELMARVVKAGAGIPAV